MLRTGLDGHAMVTELSRCRDVTMIYSTGVLCCVALCSILAVEPLQPRKIQYAKSCFQPPVEYGTCLCAGIARPAARRTNQDACKHNRSRPGCTSACDNGVALIVMFAMPHAKAAISLQRATPTFEVLLTCFQL